VGFDFIKSRQIKSRNNRAHNFRGAAGGAGGAGAVPNQGDGGDGGKGGTALFGRCISCVDLNVRNDNVRGLRGGTAGAGAAGAMSRTRAGNGGRARRSGHAAGYQLVKTKGVRTEKVSISDVSTASGSTGGAGGVSTFGLGRSRAGGDAGVAAGFILIRSDNPAQISNQVHGLRAGRGGWGAMGSRRGRDGVAAPKVTKGKARGKWRPAGRARR
jgi:hypothetical protein